MTSELKPCPFCGGEPAFESYDRLYSIGCHKCGYSRGFHGPITTIPHGKPINKEEYYNPNARDEAIAAWNTRAEQKTRIQKDQVNSLETFETCVNCGFISLRFKGEVSIFSYGHCPNCGAKVVS